MHGVGHSYATEAFEVFGLPPFSSVDIQCAPDPDFPTVDFPNPEEGEGALRLAIEHADANGLSFIFANDPDADRLAVAEKQETGEWRLFTGNETATIFAWWQLRQHVQRNADPDVSNVAMVSGACDATL
jgi:phosphomannomutase